ncbi:MAG: UbiD family decarboxylase, partial [Rhodospirillales bacterium]|nr:UbiD family decarboxylase [Rhodospirillales bacterium]
MAKASVQTDLRAFLGSVGDAGQIQHVSGAHWDKEVGAITEVLYREQVEKAPLLLFDDIPGYPKGYRCLYGMLGSPLRLASALGLDAGISLRRRAMLDAFRDKIRDHEPIPPRMVNGGPVLENVDDGDDVNLLKFPVPIHHEEDGGRYIGTACGVITRDPDTGRINVGTYRVQVIDGKTCASYISNGKQGRIHRDKYHQRGEPCPMAIVVGIDPVTYLSARYTLADHVPELDWAGGLAGQAIDCFEGAITGLPIPVNSEIVLEGWCPPGKMVPEGPFGEWTGYYAGGEKDEPAIDIKRVYHRDDPILTCAASQKPPHSHLYERCFIRSAALLDSMEGAGIPDVQDVWVHQAGSGRTFVVLAIKQRYFGHSTQVGVVASQVNPVGYAGRYVVVVDDDIDPGDIHEVIWAMGTRSDPKVDFTHLEKCWSSRLDPMVTDDKYYNNRVIIDACI